MSNETKSIGQVCPFHGNYYDPRKCGVCSKIVMDSRNKTKSVGDMIFDEIWHEFPHLNDYELLTIHLCEREKVIHIIDKIVRERGETKPDEKQMKREYDEWALRQTGPKESERGEADTKKLEETEKLRKRAYKTVKRLAKALQSNIGDGDLSETAVIKLLCDLQKLTEERDNALTRLQAAEADTKFTFASKLISELECPWPESVWPMTEAEYVKAITDERNRTAISGAVMRWGWENCKRELRRNLDALRNESAAMKEET